MIFVSEVIGFVFNLHLVFLSFLKLSLFLKETTFVPMFVYATIMKKSWQLIHEFISNGLSSPADWCTFCCNIAINFYYCTFVIKLETYQCDARSFAVRSKLIWLCNVFYCSMQILWFSYFLEQSEFILRFQKKSYYFRWFWHFSVIISNS